MEVPVSQVVAGRNWQSGRLGGAALWLVEPGIGEVNTAHALTCAQQAAIWIIAANVNRGVQP